jgi:hypothetical protein
MLNGWCSIHFTALLWDWPSLTLLAFAAAQLQQPLPSREDGEREGTVAGSKVSLNSVVCAVTPGNHPSTATCC